MGTGSWTKDAFAGYVSTTRDMTLDAFETSAMSTKQVYKANFMRVELSPRGIMRECCENEEHPNTLPVILALDVTGSMGTAAVMVAQQLNTIMTDIYTMNTGYDVEFCVMGIGDLSYDRAPIQMSQFESDIRIAEQLDMVYFEFGGGGNKFESYTAAWYMGARHTKLDCWNRGQKGIIITLGDEQLNPYLPCRMLHDATNDTLQADVETDELYKEVCEKYDVYHISVDDSHSAYSWNNADDKVDKSWEMLGDHYKVATLNSLAKTITEIVAHPETSTTGGISW